MASRDVNSNFLTKFESTSRNNFPQPDADPLEASNEYERQSSKASPSPGMGRGKLRHAVVVMEMQWRSLIAVLRSKSLKHWLLLFLSCVAMLVAFPVSSLVTRAYFVDGGRSKWLVTWLGTAAWPITAALLVTFCVVKREYPTPITWGLTVAYSILGFLSAADNLLFSYAYAYLPASTAALLASTSLAFTAIFAYLLVDGKFNSSKINAVIFMTTAAVILGLDSNSDRPYGVTSGQYASGFVFVIAGSALHGLIFALTELVFIKMLGRRSFRLVLEVQTATSFLGAIFATIPTLIVGDFKTIHTEAHNFLHGPSEYYQVIVWSAVSIQIGVLGGVGCLFLGSTLLAGVLNAARAPTTAVGAVIIFSDPMGGYKILAVVITVWSFAIYMWGSYEQQKSSAKKSRSFPSGREHTSHSPNPQNL